MAEYFYTDGNGKIRGPVPYKKLHALAAFGSVPRDARVREAGADAQAGGEPPWRPIAEVLPPDTMPTPARRGARGAAPAEDRPSSLGAWSLLLGVAAFLLSAFAPVCLAGPVALGAVVCGHLAFVGGRRATMSGGLKVAAIIGLVLGYLGVLAGIGGVVAVLAAVAAGASAP